MINSNEKAIPQKKSYKIDVQEGQTYVWCECGRSKNQPFCDGSHSGTSFSPTFWTSNKTGIVGFCGCKQTKTPPLCDGAHKEL